MAKLPIFDETPVLRPQQVASGAAGIDNIGNLFDKSSRVGFETAASVYEAESAAHLYRQSALITQAFNDYELSLKADQDPVKGDIHYKGLQNTFKTIFDNSTLNYKDRSTLQKQIESQALNAEKSLGMLKIESSKRSAQLSLATDFPLMLQNVGANLLSDPELAQRQINNVQGVLGGAVKKGYLTIPQFERYNKIVQTVVDRTGAILARGDSLKAHAEEFHATNAFLNPANIPGAGPINVATSNSYAHLKTEMNFKDVIAQLHTGNYDNGIIVYALNNMSDNQFVKFLETADGIADAKGLINSGHPYPAIEENLNYLNHRNAATLTESETAKRDHLALFVDNMKHDYLGTIQSTPEGQSISQNYMAKIASIRENFALNPQQKMEQETFARNEYVGDLINYGRATGVPPDIIKPFDAQTVATAQSAFNFNSDPKSTIQMLNTLTPVNAAYLASSMEKPNQQQTLMMASILGKDKSGMVDRLVYANQNGINYGVLNFGKDNISEQALKATVASKLSDVLSYLGHQPKGDQASAGVYEATVNLVKYQALVNGDLSLKNINSYIKQAVDTVSRAYQVQAGSFYSFNISRQQMNAQDAHALANYVREETISHISKNASREEVMQALDLNPLYVSMDESGMVNVIDSRGTIRYQEPFTPTLLGAARLNSRTTETEIREHQKKFPKYVGGLPNIGQAFGSGSDE